MGQPPVPDSSGPLDIDGSLKIFHTWLNYHLFSATATAGVNAYND